ncbi:polyprenyl synthetase family protein [Mariniblastus fucicola]|uniref:Octaprenyl-diphosphate synthase n=1 Tax=Mariniblastus fucicola TaxID=980251 RepID=A0A5B9PAP4_9BACT|nr:polyprenyl synthetase family protein [Mariniblastus fucicola]QEG21566.1 Octaprenyl-diphosphate synthase [Mariniblastus fucicola]
MSNVIGQSVSNEPEVGVALSGNGRAGTESSLFNVYGVIANELSHVEATISSELQNSSAEVELLLSHSRSLGGKRLRPALLLLTGKAVGTVSESHIFAAAALEMIHLATLIHDDVLDDAKTRRHQETAHAKFGTRPGVLLGDYLFTHSFSVGSKANSIEAIKMLAQASNLVCEGEIKQNAWQSDFSIDEPAYLQMVSEKTGELCAAGCGIGAVLSGADIGTIESFKSFGRDLGVAFQIIDDVLDLVGDAETVGKTLGTDLQNRKVTLPVIHALATREGKGRDSLLTMLNAETVSVAEVVSALKETGSIDYARGVAKSIAERAVGFAAALPESDASKSLGAIGQMMLKRTF